MKNDLSSVLFDTLSGIKSKGFRVNPDGTIKRHSKKIQVRILKMPGLATNYNDRNRTLFVSARDVSRTQYLKNILNLK